MGTITVLIVDDEPKIRGIVREALRGDVKRVLEARTGKEAIALAEAERPDLIVLDLGLPDMDGVEVCRSVRAWSSVPILVLSARAAEGEKAALLDAGADDYVTKPFSTVEFTARARAQVRRAQMPPVPGGDAPLVIGALTIDTGRRRVVRAGEEVHLTPTEWGLLRALVARADRPVTHEQLFREVWGGVAGDAQQYLRVYVAHLRRKLEADSYHPRLIVTEPGVGYRFVLEESLRDAAAAAAAAAVPDDATERPS
jgi:two-component system KDP operon response regulator KdpE